MVKLSEHLRRTGVFSTEEVNRVMPPPEVLKKGPVAVVECIQEIPCDPCHASCPFGAIKEFKDINDLPEIDWEKCTGCTLCVAKCPGLAIFVVDASRDDNDALLKLPYEFYPVPEKGEEVELLNRVGEVVGKGKVRSVIEPHKDGTKVVTVHVSKDMIADVRHVRVVR